MKPNEMAIVCQIAKLSEDNYNFIVLCTAHILNCESSEKAIECLDEIFKYEKLSSDEIKILNRIKALLTND